MLTLKLLAVGRIQNARRCVLLPMRYRPAATWAKAFSPQWLNGKKNAINPAGRRRGHAPLCEKTASTGSCKTGFQLFQFPRRRGLGRGEGGFFWWSPWRQKNNQHIDVIADLADLLDDEVKNDATGRCRQQRSVYAGSSTIQNKQG